MRDIWYIEVSYVYVNIKQHPKQFLAFYWIQLETQACHQFYIKLHICGMRNGVYSGVPSAIHTKVVSCTHVLLSLILCLFVLFSLTNPCAYFMKQTCTTSASGRVTDTKLWNEFRMFYLISFYGAWNYMRQSHFIFQNQWKSSDLSHFSYRKFYTLSNGRVPYFQCRYIS